MALSSIHDVAGHHATPHHPHHPHQHPHQPNAISRIQHVVIDHEKHFRPNPDAKPFIPNMAPPFHAANNWHFFQGENAPKSINGLIPPFWMGAPMIDNENLLAAGSSNTSKQHIAFHLVSNVLDDEIPEDKEIPPKAQLHHPMHHPIMNPSDQNQIPGNEINELVNNWHESAVNFTLPIEAEKSASDKSSINNKSIHEIWSPDPSPNDLSNVTNNEEILNTYKQQPQQQTQVIDSPNSAQTVAVDNSDNSFEQITSTESSSQQHDTSKYSEGNSEENESQSPNQSNQNDVPSPVYRQHYFDVNQRSMYHGYHKNMMYSNVRPVMDPNYYTHSHYYHRYPYYGGVPNYKTRQKHCGDIGVIPSPSTMYNGSISAVEELGIGIDECRDQLKHLERDCKKADLSLLQNFRLRKSSFSDSSSSKYPANSSRVDKLIIDQEKEHQKVESLIGRIERLGFTPMHPNVGIALDSWFTSIKDLRSARKNEITNMHEMNDGIHSMSRSHTQADVCNLIGSVKELTKHTRTARTIVWCALQMLYANASSCASSGSGD